MPESAAKHSTTAASPGLLPVSARAIARSADFLAELTALLVELCSVDTTPRADVSAAEVSESRAFAILERELARLAFPQARTWRAAIDPAIADHPFYSPPYYTQAVDASGPLPAEACYAGRSNLLFGVDGRADAGSGRNLAINVHVDVVRPFIPPRVVGRTVFGRGACDDKGNVVALLGALRLVGGVLAERGQVLNRPLTCMFVIDEETGGNGSLSCALDGELTQRYESLVVLECTNAQIHPGNRGCVWYKVAGAAEGVNLFEAAAFIIEALEQNGRAIRGESDHPLFPHRPVQTCHGIIGACGEHPSRINGDVSFDVAFEGRASAAAEGAIAEVLDAALAEYVADYGDKTQVIDPATGASKVARHYDLSRTASGWRVRVWGATGHMGAIAENDGAITKTATLVRGLVAARERIAASAGAPMQVVLADWSNPSKLLLEGGQGFLPTHALEDIQERMSSAVRRGAARYAAVAHLGTEWVDGLAVTFDKLHNAAFARDPQGADVQAALASARAVGMMQEAPLRGWDVSCDARLFACIHPELPVVTVGAGALRHAHADDEQMDMGAVAQMAEFLADLILRQTGTA